MKPIIHARPVFTRDVARSTGTNTGMVRGAISRKLVPATKVGSRWTFTMFQAVAASIILSLRRIGISWVEMPKVLGNSIYHFPPECPPEHERTLQQAEEAKKLFLYLEAMLFDLRVVVKTSGDRRSRSVEFWQEEQAPELDITNPVTLIPVDVLYKDIHVGGANTAPNGNPKGRLESAPFSGKMGPVIAAPAPTEQTSHQKTLNDGTLVVGQSCGKPKNRSRAGREPQSSTPKSHGNSPNEIKRQALVESLKRASQMAQDPGVAADYSKLSKLGYLLEDMYGTAMDVAVDLVKNRDN